MYALGNYSETREEFLTNVNSSSNRKEFFQLLEKYSFTRQVYHRNIG